MFDLQVKKPRSDEAKRLLEKLACACAPLMVSCRVSYLHCCSVVILLFCGTLYEMIGS